MVAEARMACRPGCGACCIAPSISSLNKPAGKPCHHLDGALKCKVFARPERPACCGGLQPSLEMCGNGRDQALLWLTELERITRPTEDRASPPRPPQQTRQQTRLLALNDSDC